MISIDDQTTELIIDLFDKDFLQSILDLGDDLFAMYNIRISMRYTSKGDALAVTNNVSDMFSISNDYHYIIELFKKELMEEDTPNFSLSLVELLCHELSHVITWFDVDHGDNWKKYSEYIARELGYLKKYYTWRTTLTGGIVKIEKVIV